MLNKSFFQDGIPALLTVSAALLLVTLPMPCSGSRLGAAKRKPTIPQSFRSLLWRKINCYVRILRSTRSPTSLREGAWCGFLVLFCRPRSAAKADAHSTHYHRVYLDLNRPKLYRRRMKTSLHHLITVALTT